MPMTAKPPLREYEVLFYSKSQEVVVKYIFANTEAEALEHWRSFYQSVHSNGTPPFYLREVVKDEFLHHESVVIALPNGTHWQIRIYPIACSHAQAHSEQYGGEIGRTLKEGTLPHFKKSKQHILDWVKKMGWAEIEKNAQPVKQYDYEKGLKQAKLVM